VTDRDHNPGEQEAARLTAIRAISAPRAIDALRAAKSALNLSYLRHSDRFMDDISIMIDAIEAQRHE
jgi:hypothetical protein